MFRFRASLLGCVLTLALHAQPHQFEWARQFGAPIGGAGEQTRAAATDGTSHVAGGTTGGAMGGETHAGGIDGFVRKYNTSGAVQWTRQIGTAGTDDVNGLAIDSSGNVIVSGTVCGTLPGQSPAGDCDAYVRKYDPAGNISWTRQFGTAAGDFAAKVAVDAAGNIAVTGATRGSFSGFTLLGFSDVFVTKLDATGAILWTRQFGTPGSDDGAGVTFDATGAIIAGGGTSDAFPGKTNAGSTDGFLAKISAAGGLVWVEQFGTSIAERVREVAIDAAGNIFAVVPISSAAQLRKFTPAGVPSSTVGIGDDIYSLAVNGNEITIAGSTDFAYPGFTNLGGRDAYIRRLNAATLAQIWVQQFGTSQFDEAMAVAMTGSTIFVAGHTSGAFPGFSPADLTDLFARQYTTAGALQWTDQVGSTAPGQSIPVSTFLTATRIISAGQATGALPTATRVGAEDAFVAVHDLAGNLIWLRQFGSAEFDHAAAVTADSAGNIYVAGSTQGILPGQSKSGSTDSFIRKYDAAGNEIWTRQFGGGATSLIQISGIVVDAAGDIFIAGQSGATGAYFQALARRYNSAGSLLWSTQFGTTDDDYARGIALDATGGVIIAGQTAGGEFPGQTKVGNADAYVARLNAANGAVTWVTQFGPGASQIASVRSVSIAPDGSIFAVGDNTGAYPTQVAAGGTFDISLAKLTSAGTVSWIRQFGSSASDRGLAAIGDAAGNVTVVGSLGNSTVTDAVLRRYDTNGNVLGTLVNSTPQLDLMISAAGNAGGVIAAVGYTTSAFPGQTQTGLLDALILKFLPPNAPPSIAANNALVAVNEGATATNSGTFADANPGDVVTLSASIGTVVKGAGTWTWSAAAIEGPFAAVVTITANDGHGGITSTTFNYTIANLPPALGTATGPTAAVAIGTPVTIAAPVSDPGVTDPITCRFNWDDGSTDTVSPAASGACSAAHTFAAAGVYGVTITASDDDGGSATTRFDYVIVFDPTAGFVTGGGHIDTPTGKANFGAVARYQKNSALPTGQTEFHAGSLRFNSDAYEWLVLSGPNAQYKGTGSINGVAGYSFIVTMTDAKLAGSGGVNKFRITIWPTATPGTITYDNVPGASDDISLANPQPLGGGSVNIQNK